MNLVITAGFRALLGQLPESIRQQAFRAYALWRDDPHHPSLQFKRVSRASPFTRPARTGVRRARALGGDMITGFWIGSHAEYDTLLGRLHGNQP